MGFVGIAQKDDIVYFAADFAVRSDYRCAVDAGTHVHNGVFAQGHRSAQKGAFHDFGIGTYVHRTAGDIDYGAFNFRAFFDEYKRGVAYDGVCGAERCRLPSRGYPGEVGSYSVAGEHENIVGASYRFVFIVPYQCFSIGGSASGNDSAVAGAELLSGLQPADRLCQCGIGQYVSGDEQSVFVVVGDGAGIFFQKVVFCRQETVVARQ